MKQTFLNRQDAGRQLAQTIKGVSDDRSPVVLALPRGGVPVAYEVAQAMHAPLDILMVRKIGAPIHPEYAIGAVAEGDIKILDQEAIAATKTDAQALQEAIDLAHKELVNRGQVFRDSMPGIDFTDRPVIIIDDGLATGSTMLVAIEAARRRGASTVSVAVPVTSHQARERVAAAADHVITLHSPIHFNAVGAWYKDFGQTSTDEVIELLNRANQEQSNQEVTFSGETVEIEIGGGQTVAGTLTIPYNHCSALVVFAHGSGSSRHSPRNQEVATQLNQTGLATLLLDLLTENEEGDRAKVFDITLLASRLMAAVDWAEQDERTRIMTVGLFGASTGAGAALVCAAQSRRIAAVVSRGGRPDLAGEALSRVEAPTLLIVGGLDYQVIELNQIAAAHIPGPVELTIIPGATHLFEEPGTLDQVAALSSYWLQSKLIEANQVTD